MLFYLNTIAMNYKFEILKKGKLVKKLTYAYDRGRDAYETGKGLMSILKESGEGDQVVIKDATNFITSIVFCDDER